MFSTSTDMQPLPIRLLLPTVLPMLRLMLQSMFRGDGSAFEPPPRVYDQYDFVIVGGGTAGSVMAARLSEVREWKVLLLEAGGVPTPETRVPGLSRLFYFPSAVNWNYELAPQRHGLRNYDNRSSPIPQGRVLGGSSSINGMLYVRGNRRDYDNWAALGNPGWDYESVLPYFKKSEDFRGPHRGETEHYHGRGGPYTVTPKEGPHLPITNAFLRAGQHLGFDVIDPSGPEQIDYIRQENRAVGVVYKHNDQIKTVYARREVILSTGALVSPKLLMLSGVGAGHQLRRHGIKVVADLPGVGQNLQDHMCLYGLTWNVDVRTPNVAFEAVNPGVIRQYASERKGLYTTPLGEFGHAWSRVSGEGDPYWPDVQLFMVSSGLGQEGLMAAHALGLNSAKFMEYFTPQFGRPGLTMMPYLMRPKSRGAVLLRSRNPFDAPVVDPNYLSHPDDIDPAIRWALKVGETPPFALGLGAKFYSRCQEKPFGSDAYWRCFVLHMATTFYHFGGTCKMGPESDPYSVLDEKLRVRGVNGLRVVDGSSMPVVTTLYLSSHSLPPPLITSLPFIYPPSTSHSYP
ncbi:putative glucose dehydrogenase [Penaeus vannamei]|uniref:Putative glucose dehydrogenase n=1 Tax=Penaeus vannamei TaxID=6689 RepID=A0A3R7ML78_PENVA|nr:putative glucose dehydrogenase [Penaeus vannamei]